MATQSAAKKIAAKPAPQLILIKKKESILLKEISFLEKHMENYKSERKASWKAFKNKMEADIQKLKASVADLTYEKD